MKQRLDTLLAERGFARSRSAAAASIRAGQVRIGPDGPVALRPSQLVATDADIVLSKERQYVSRGGEKLAPALDALGIEPEGLGCLDVGASTGGFTDCLLQRGAREVIALDVGHGQLDWGLRNDPRVHVIERFNARELTPADLPFAPELVTVDVSFISVVKLLPAIRETSAPGARVVAMVKPQFELGRERVRGGVVRDRADRREAVERVIAAAVKLGLHAHGVAAAGVSGPKGNVETFVELREREPEAGFDLDAALEREVG